MNWKRRCYGRKRENAISSLLSSKPAYIEKSISDGTTAALLLDYYALSGYLASLVRTNVTDRRYAHNRTMSGIESQAMCLYADWFANSHGWAAPDLRLQLFCRSPIRLPPATNSIMIAFLHAEQNDEPDSINHIPPTSPRQAPPSKKAASLVILNRSRMRCLGLAISNMHCALLAAT